MRHVHKGRKKCRDDYYGAATGGEADTGASDAANDYFCGSETLVSFAGRLHDCLPIARASILIIWYNIPMSVQELETAVTQLPSPELAQFSKWFEEYQADLWDKQIEQDALSGRLDALAEQANGEFEAGRCRPL